MNYRLLLTPELKQSHWEDLANVFNETMDRNLPVEYFKQKYHETVKGYSYHGLLFDSGNQVIGAFSAIPYEFQYMGRSMIFALGVDTFVHKDHRSNPLHLRKLTQLTEESLKKDGIPFIYAIPNENSCFYLKKMCKWVQIGELDYYITPAKAGSLLKRFSRINIFSKPAIRVLNALDIWRFRHDHQTVNKRISLIRSAIFEKNRFYEYHKSRILDNNTKLRYRLYDENGIQALYIVDLHPLSPGSMANAISFLLKNENFDLILYIGIQLHQLLCLRKVPKKYVPRTLNFIGKILLPEVIDPQVLDRKEWNFNLAYFDTR